MNGDQTKAYPDLESKLGEIFKYHSPNEEQVGQYSVIRNKALDLASLIVKLTPASADQTAAIRLLRQAVMKANAAIALNGLV